MRNRFAVGLLFAAVALAATDWNEAGKQWWSHIEYLAGDQLGGRAVGSPGFDKAAAYVAEQFERAGLEPGGEGNYFQRVQFTKISLDQPKSSIEIVQSGRTTPVAIPDEAQLAYGADSAPSLTVPVVFAGYGLRIPEARFNDLKGLNVRGAIVAYLTGGPESINGNLRSHYSSSKERWNALREAGAVGMISIANPKDMEIPWARQGAAWGRPRVTFADPSLVPTRGMKFGASWDPARADHLFAGSGHTFSEILSAAQNQKPLPHFKLACQIKAATHVTTDQIESKNVVGLR